MTFGMVWASGVGTDLTCNPIQVDGTRTSDVQSGSPTDRVPVQKTQTPVDKTRYNKDLEVQPCPIGLFLDSIWTQCGQLRGGP